MAFIETSHTHFNMHFGRYSVLLAAGLINGMALAALLWRRRVNRVANHVLAMLVAFVALRLMPYVLGYAGGYDTYPWLTFAPFDLSLAFGPLLWMYVIALTRGTLPANAKRHFVPAALQLGYQVTCFALPAPAKWNWYSGYNLAVIEPLALAASLVSLAAYLNAAFTALQRYQRWLRDRYSDVEGWRLDWLYQLLAATAVTLAIACAYALTNWVVTPVSYLGRLPQMIAFALLAYILGALGWRYGETNYPVHAVQDVAVADGDVDIVQAPSASAYVEQSADWVRRVAEAEWWRDSTLTLSSLAALLDSSPRTVSRVLSEGRGQTFHEFINRMRVSGVVEQLERDGDTCDLLAIALDCGFNSKASFNRAFKAYTRQTPSEFRRGKTPV